MAQVHQTPRRFYIDRADDQPVVRRVPVHVQETTSPATHQVPAVSDRASTAGTRARTRLTPWRVTQLVRSARHRSRHHHS